MMKVASRIGFAFVALMLMAGPAKAAPVVLTFEGLGDLEPVNNYYDGGYGGNGSGPGPNYGITFGSDSLALIDQTSGGSGNTGNDPSPHTVLVFLSGPGDVMDVAAGFNTGFSFYYAVPFYTGSVTVWSGMDGTGTLLGSINLPLTPDGSPYNYSVWEPAGVAFAGTAMSAIFSGTANYIVFDNITLGSSTPGVPEPSSMVLIGIGGIGLFLFDRRRRAKAVVA